MPSAEAILANELGDTRLTVDLYSRVITIPASIKNLGVENDDEVFRLPFAMPRYYGEFDLSEFKVKINYLNAKSEGDIHEPEDVTIADDEITFSWLVGRHAYTKAGTVEFNVCLKKYSEENIFEVIQEFNTTPTTLSVLKGLETTERIVSEHLDILEQWKRDMTDNLENRVPYGTLSYKNSLLSVPVTGNWVASDFGGPLMDQKFVAISTKTDVAMYSTDGFEWRETTLPVAMGWSSVASNHFGHVVVASGTTERDTSNDVALYSRDGVIWEQIALPLSIQWKSIAASDGTFVAVGASGMAAYSNDGQNWTATSINAGGYNWLAVGCGKVDDHTRFVMLDANSPVGAYSDDGINWMACNTANLMQYGGWRYIMFGNGKFVAMNDGGRVTYSTDGINWSAPTSISTSSSVTRLHVNNTVEPAVFIATSQYNDAYAHSIDGVNWTVTEIPNAKYWTTMVAAEGHIFALTSLYSNTFYYSKDGINWSDRLQGIFTDGSNDTTEAIRELIGGGNGVYMFDISSSIVDGVTTWNCDRSFSDIINAADSGRLLIARLIHSEAEGLSAISQTPNVVIASLNGNRIVQILLYSINTNVGTGETSVRIEGNWWYTADEGLLLIGGALKDSD